MRSRQTPADWAYLLELLKRCSAYLNGDERFTNRQVDNLARTLKTVLKHRRSHDSPP
jgi:hypothetical protein